MIDRVIVTCQISAEIYVETAKKPILSLCYGNIREKFITGGLNCINLLSTAREKHHLIVGGGILLSSLSFADFNKCLHPRALNFAEIT
jgi:hypothetical protein